MKRREVAARCVRPPLRSGRAIRTGQPGIHTGSDRYERTGFLRVPANVQGRAVDLAESERRNCHPSARSPLRDARTA